MNIYDASDNQDSPLLLFVLLWHSWGLWPSLVRIYKNKERRHCYSSCSSARDECVPGRKTFSDATVSGHYFFFIFLSIFCFCLDISFVQAVALCGCTFYLLLLWRYINKYLIQKRWEERERPLSFASGIVWRRAKLIDLIWCHLGVRSGRQRMKNGGQSIDFQLGQLLFLYRFPSKKDIRQMVKHFGIMHVSFIWFRWGANNWFRRSSNHYFLFASSSFCFYMYSVSIIQLLISEWNVEYY